MPVCFCRARLGHDLADLAAGCDVNALYAPLPKTQPVKRDLSLLIDSTVSMADIEAAVRDAERRILDSVELFDVYEGDKLPAGKKSYAISITLQDPEKTLQDKYIDKVMAKVIDTLKSQLQRRTPLRKQYQKYKPTLNHFKHYPWEEHLNTAKPASSNAGAICRAHSPASARKSPSPPRPVVPTPTPIPACVL